MKAKITQALVERVSAVTDKTTLYADPELRGFYLSSLKARKASTSKASSTGSRSGSSWATIRL